MASRILGFVRDKLTAYYVGTGPIAQAFVVANRLPNLFRALFGEGAFNSAFVPELSGLLHNQGEQAATRFAAEAIAVMAFWLSMLTIAGEIFMPGLVWLQASGYAGDPAKFGLTVDLARIAFPYLMLICLSALLSGILNTLHRFTAASIAPVINNMVAIAALLVLTPYLPTAGHALAIGVSISGAIQLVVLAWAVQHGGMRISVPRPRLTPEVRLLLRRMGPGLLAAGAIQISQSVDVVIASWLPDGAAAVLYYAQRLYQLPLGTVGVAVGTAILPLLTSQVRTGKTAAAIETMNRGLEFALFLTIPAALALCVTAEPLTWVLFGGGAFTREAAHLSAQSLAAYAPGLVAFVLLKVLQPGFFARGDTKTPMRVTMATLGLNLMLNLIFFRAGLAHVGPPLAGSLAAIINVAWLSLLLIRHGYLVADATLRRRVPRMALAGTAMAALLWFLQNPLFAAVQTLHLPGERVLALGLLVGAGLIGYFAAGQLVGAFHVRELKRLLRRGAA